MLEEQGLPCSVAIGIQSYWNLGIEEKWQLHYQHTAMRHLHYWHIVLWQCNKKWHGVN